MHDLAAVKSYFSRTDQEVWAAISEAGRRIHQNVCKEFRGYWIKWDTSTIAIVDGTDQYQCPVDLGQIIRFSEKLASEQAYRQMEPADITSDTFADRQFDPYIGYNSGPKSDFVFYGPYLDQADALLNQGNQPASQYYQVKLAPVPEDNRVTEIIYAARYVEIINSQSPNVIPTEGHGVQLDYAVAELLKGNNDSLMGQYDASGKEKMSEFLTWIRSRQIYQYPTQETYVDDLS